MIKSICLALALVLSASLFAGQHKKNDKSIHHAAMHAEHWLNHHSNPPKKHRKLHFYPKKNHKDKSTHHAAMHAEHWLKHHASAPHR